MKNKFQKLSDTDLVKYCQTFPNDQLAWREFFSRHYNYIRFTAQKYFNLSKSFLKHVELDDIIQTASEKILTAVREHLIKDPDALYGYLKVLIKNTVRDYIRKTPKEIPTENEVLDNLSHVHDADTIEDISTILPYIKPYILAAVDRLSNQYRMLIEMKLAGKSNKEIQRELNIVSVPAAKQQIYRATNTFRIELVKGLEEAMHDARLSPFDKDILDAFLRNWMGG